MTDDCGVSLVELIDYRFGELSDAQAQRIEEHLFECGPCADRASTLVDLGQLVRTIVADGGLQCSVAEDAVHRAEELGLRLRTYHIDPGQAVACTAAPEDDFIVVRLRVQADSRDRIDVETTMRSESDGKERSSVTEDVTMDQRSSEIVYLFPGNLVRSYPKATFTMHANIRGDSGARRVGPYTMNHTPWAELAPGS